MFLFYFNIIKNKFLALYFFLCLGNARPNAVEALSAWGAQFRSHHSGYNREIVTPR